MNKYEAYEEAINILRKLTGKQILAADNEWIFAQFDAYVKKFNELKEALTQ